MEQGLPEQIWSTHNKTRFRDYQYSRMKAIALQRHGVPSEACFCVETDRPEELPAQIGIEGVGMVTAVGGSVEEFSVGDLVLSLGRSNGRT